MLVKGQQLWKSTDLYPINNTIIQIILNYTVFIVHVHNVHFHVIQGSYVQSLPGQTVQLYLINYFMFRNLSVEIEAIDAQRQKQILVQEKQARHIISQMATTVYGQLIR